MKDVVCPNCGTLFGKQTEETLAIKYRDLYRSIRGEAWGPCRGCGNIVKWPPEASQKTEDTR